MATWTIYTKFKKAQLDGSGVIQFGTDTLKILLTTVTYVPAQDTDANLTNVTNEVAGTNYAAGGIALTGVTVTASVHTIIVNSNDITWSQSGTGFNNARIAVLYKRTGVAGTSLLIAYADLGGSLGNVFGDLTLQINANNIFTLV